MLHGQSILVVEDQAIIGMALAAAIRNAGGKVVGPAASAKSALDLIDGNSLSAAVLDVTLADGTVAPVIEALVERGIPFIIQSGVGLPGDLALRFPDMIVLIKPTTSTVMIDEIAKLIGNQAACAITPLDPHDASPIAPVRSAKASATELR